VHREAAHAAEPDPPAVPARLEPLELDAEALADGESFELVEVAGAALQGVDARSLGFMEARLEAVDLSGAQLTSLFLSDCELVRCNLANAKVHGGSMRRVAITGGRLTGLLWTSGALRDAGFRDCRADMASLNGATLERVTFSGCNLRDADLRGTRCKSVAFRDCDLTGADLAGARFERCEMSACTLEGLRGVDRLRGVAMPWADIVANAATWAGQLGIRVLDADRS
jgi:uncharacterized protein YjbI with pentapeptide repeats